MKHRYPPRDLVPDEYRVSPLPGPVRDWADRKVSHLVEAWELRDEYDEGYTDRVDTILASNEREVKWYQTGSERDVLSIGQTFDGKPLGPTHGIVLKFNPLLAQGEPHSLGSSGNLHEIVLWATALKEGFDHLLGSIIDYADDGSWLAMREYTPVYQYHSPTPNGIDFLRSTSLDLDIIGRLKTDLLDTGIEGHFKDGNVGIPLDDITSPVLIDYGSHTQLVDRTKESLIDDYLPETSPE